jgi:hypothetical protein
MDIESKEHRAGHLKGNNFKHLSTYVPSSSSCRHSKVISNWNGLRKHVGLSNTTFKNRFFNRQLKNARRRLDLLEALELAQFGATCQKKTSFRPVPC